MRVFLDTNVLISALITRGLSSEIFRLIVNEHQLFVCETVLPEFERILISKFKTPRNKTKEILEFL